MAFPVAMYRCESLTIKKAELWRIDAFKLWCWRRLLRVPWTARRSVNPKGNQPWIFIGRIDAKAEAPILSPPDAKNRLIGKDPDAGKDWGKEEKGVTECNGWDCITNSMGMSLSKLQEIMENRETWCVAVHGVTKSQTWLSDWTTTSFLVIKSKFQAFLFGNATTTNNGFVFL